MNIKTENDEFYAKLGFGERIKYFFKTDKFWEYSVLQLKIEKSDDKDDVAKASIWVDNIPKGMNINQAKEFRIMLDKMIEDALNNLKK